VGTRQTPLERAMAAHEFAVEARNLEFRKIAVQGAVSGLFFAQTVSWQELVDAIVTHVVGVSSSDPWFALWRAVLVTLMTTGVAYVLLVCVRRCDRAENNTG
jgi:hypothetical protein